MTHLKAGLEEQLARVSGTEESPVAAAERRGVTPLDEWPDPIDAFEAGFE